MKHKTERRFTISSMEVKETYQLTRRERSALLAIAKGLGEYRRGHVDFDNVDDKKDDTGTVYLIDCWALNRAGFLVLDEMACHGYQFDITGVGIEAVKAWDKSLALGLTVRPW